MLSSSFSPPLVFRGRIVSSITHYSPIWSSLSFLFFRYKYLGHCHHSFSLLFLFFVFLIAKRPSLFFSLIFSFPHSLSSPLLFTSLLFSTLIYHFSFSPLYVSFNQKISILILTVFPSPFCSRPLHTDRQL